MFDRERGPLRQIGRYQVIRLLGRGAMGEVLLAHDPVLERQVAIKYLRRDLNILPEQRDSLTQRLWQEARASARVSHPNIVALHDMGEDSALGPYLVFEYLEGPTLKARLMEGALAPKAAARLARELGEALATAHQAGVLHRDIKPENVMLSRVGPKIADFGIARLPNSTLTHGGALLGTPAYSAPETLQGSKFSPASDQFSLAATLYEALSGRRAFPGDDALQVATRVRNDEPEWLARRGSFHESVDTILARAFAKNPRARFTDCAEFGRALARALDNPLELGTEPEPRPLAASQPDATTALSAPIASPAPESSRLLSWPVLTCAAIAVLAGCIWLANAFGSGSATETAPRAGARVESPRTTMVPEKSEPSVTPHRTVTLASSAARVKPPAPHDRLAVSTTAATKSEQHQRDAGTKP